MLLEDKELCKKCGGYCCKKCGCDYYIEDFETLNLKYLEEKLKEGKMSIVAAMNFTMTKTDKLICTPLLYLRARNQNRDIVDLLSMKTTCASLTKEGCIFSFKERPSGGKNLIPKENMKCYQLIDANDKILEWFPYQNVLAKLVKRFTHKTVDEKLKEDVVSLINNILNKNFDGIAKEEIEDLNSLLPMLIKTFPKEALKPKKCIQNKIHAF